MHWKGAGKAVCIPGPSQTAHLVKDQKSGLESEVSHKEKNIVYINTYIWNLEK